MDGIADYEFIRALAQGSQGRYFLARTPARLPVADEFVAVKVLDGETTPEVFRLATSELQAYAAVGSARLVRLFDAGQQARIFFAAMEYLPGGSLASPAEPMSRPDTLLAVAGAARGADDLHEAGLVHRDIKPASVLLGPSGSKLGDLGLAQFVSPGRTLSRHGAVDSVEFVDPALLRGGRAGRASDIWALGVTLHRVLTGAGVYPDLPPGETLQAIRRVVNTRPELDKSLSDAERALIERCLAAEPADRPATAREVADALDRLA